MQNWQESGGKIKSILGMRASTMMNNCLKLYFQRAGTKGVAADLLRQFSGSALYAAGIYSVASSSGFVPGGISGLAIVLNHFVPFIPIGISTILINIPIMLVGFRILGRVYFLKSVVNMLMTAFLMDTVLPWLPVYSGDALLAAIFGGTLSGAGLSLIYMAASSAGGSDFIIMSIQKKHPQMSIGNVLLLVDGSIILLGGITYGNINSLLYGIIMTFVSATIVDKLMYGRGSKRMLLVLSARIREITDAICGSAHRGVTLIKAQGGYTLKERMLLINVCSKAEVFSIKDMILHIDPSAMLILSTVDEVFGKGFTQVEPDEGA